MVCCTALPRSSSVSSVLPCSALFTRGDLLKNGQADERYFFLGRKWDKPSQHEAKQSRAASHLWIVGSGGASYLCRGGIVEFQQVKLFDGGYITAKLS